jgi:sn-glycerol 3-phosphate transport system permease protein
MITNTQDMRMVVIGLERLIPRGGTELPDWNLIMARAIMALLPPVVVTLLMQRWFAKSLLEVEK